MNEIESAILKTICYADIFDYPLTAKEIYRYLIIDRNPEVSFNSVAAAISELVEHDRLAYQAGYYLLPGRKSLTDLRRHRHAISQTKLKLAQSIAHKLGRVPSILGIFVTGALSMANSDDTDDVDILIITRTNRLWTTRFLVTLYLELLGIRRRPRIQTAANHICANLYLDEIALALPPDQQNLYTAHEVIQTKPILNRDHVHDRFLAANRWVQEYLPHFLFPPLTNSKIQTLSTSKWENLAYRLQSWYMQSRRTRESISRHSAYFHPRDTGSQVLDRYQSKCHQIIDTIHR